MTSWWKGFLEREAALLLYGFQAEGAAPLVLGARVEQPETVASAIRIGNPARWEDAMGAFTASRGQVRSVSDAEILDAYRCSAREGVFCEPASAAWSPACSSTAPRAGSSACSPAMGSRTRRRR